MSIGNPRLTDNVHRKRQRTASQDNIERRSAKKARSGPQPQLKSTEVNLSTTTSPRQSTTRRAATDVGHDTKEDRLDFLRTNEGRHCLPDSPLPSANSPQRLPLTEESLRLLNSNTSPPEKVINAYHPYYLRALESRQIFFADKSPDGQPPGLDKWWTTLLAPRESPELDQTSIKSLRRVIDRATTEYDTLGGIVPEIIPTKALKESTTVSSVTKREWKSMLNTELEPRLTPPKPGLTIGWESDVFERFPKAMASLDAFACPVTSADYIAWPFFTIEAKGENGSGREARLRNLHNGAVMLSNIYALKQRCKREETFFDKVHVMGLEFFEGSISLSCYWATRSETGQVKYLGKTLETWCLLTTSGTHCKEARSCICNAIEWLRSEAQEWIYSDLQAIEDTLVSAPLADLMQPVYSAQSRDRNSSSTDIFRIMRTLSQCPTRYDLGRAKFSFYLLRPILSIEAMVT